jgi:hypothetical protein
MTEKEKWGIWCEVWGGITGSRSAWLKDIDAIRSKLNRIHWLWTF